MLDATSIIDYTYPEFLNGAKLIANAVKANFKPDYIVGVVRGGAVPAVYLSHELSVPVQMVHWSSRDHNLMGNETNTWIPEDINCGKRILLVDDIVDGGETITQLLADWQSCIRQKLVMENVRIASMYYNTAQDVKVDFYHRAIDRSVDSRWIHFPWES